MKFSLISTAAAFAVLATGAFANAVETVETEIGDVIAASKNGMTLYTFRNDAADRSNCYGDCAAAWPPFLAGASAQESGALGLTERRDGTRQWTLNGQPLYFWAGDAERGDVTGDGVGGVWDVARASDSSALAPKARKSRYSY